MRILYFGGTATMSEAYKVLVAAPVQVTLKNLGLHVPAPPSPSSLIHP
jgi:hypothetical protein